MREIMRGTWWEAQNNINDNEKMKKKKWVEHSHVS